MKLNINCIRDILIAAEDVITFDSFFYYTKEKPSSLSSSYSHEEIIYHIRQARDAGLITTSDFFDSGDYVYITDLTPAGHSFLADVRTPSVWERIISLGIQSLPIAIGIAKDVALAYYQKN